MSKVRPRSSFVFELHPAGVVSFTHSAVCHDGASREVNVERDPGACFKMSLRVGPKPLVPHDSALIEQRRAPLYG